MLFGRTSANSPSRFLDEIPSELIERNEAAQNDSFGASSGRSEFGSYGGVRRSYAPERPKPAFLSQQPKEPAAPVSGFEAGDAVVHTAFGEGVILKRTPMGGDSLVEIQFNAGVKRLMLKAAVAYMKKK
jgi:DNA helicase-2/ATP-dependent DNA helicase PcrA